MSHVVGFESFEVDLEGGQLRKSGVRIRLREQPFQVLASLLEHPGEVVTRVELCHRLWPDGTLVDFDNSLNIAVARVRTALGDSAAHPRYIETLPKRGYRFVGKLSSDKMINGTPGGKPTQSPTAYNEYVQARYLIGKTTPAGLAKAKQHLEKAIESDSEFALAYDALAEVCWYLGYMGVVRPRDAFAAGIVHALHAIEIDNTRGETHALLAQFHRTVEYNWHEVEREMTLALQLDPTSPLVRMRYAVSWLMPQGRMEEAVAQVEGALQLDPLSLLLRTWRALLLLIGNQHERALEAAQRVLELDAGAYWAYLTIGSVYRDRGLFRHAIAAHRRALELCGDAPHMMGWLGLTLGLSGKLSEARTLLGRLRCKAAQAYVPPTSFAWIHLGLGDRSAAFEWLNRAVEECDQMLMPIKSYTFLDPIRPDPRFPGLLRKMNLESAGAASSS